jgi:GTP-binding protein
MTRTPPPLIANKRFKLLYVTSATAKDGSILPVPTFLLFINRVELLTETYKRYLENLVRAEYGLTGLPIRFVLKPRRKDEK